MGYNRPYCWLIRARCLIQRGSGIVAGGLLATLLILVIAAVISRSLLGASLIWVEELAQWLFTALIFLGLPAAGPALAAMRVELLARHLSPNWQQGLSDGAGAYALTGLALGAHDAARLIGGVSTLLRVPEGVRFALVAVGAALSILTLIQDRHRGFRPWGPVAAGVLLALLPSAWLPDLGVAPSVIAVTILAITTLAGTPLPLAFLAAGVTASQLGAPLPLPALVQSLTTGSSRFLLLAIPFFLTTGLLMTHAGLSERLIAAARALVGHRRAGLAQTTLLTSTLFAGVSGSSIADAALGGKLLVPALIAQGEKPARAAAIVAACSVLPNIIPPSIAFLILAAAANLPVDALWRGGFWAGLLLAACLAVALHWTGRENRLVPASAAERRQALRAAAPLLGLAAAILVSLRSGLATPTETGAIAVLAAGLLGGRRLLAGGCGALLVQGARDSAAIGLLIGSAAPFAALLTLDQIPVGLASLFSAGTAHPLLVLLGLHLLLLFVGCVLDIGAALLIFGPLLLPIAVAAGIDPVHFGVMMVVNLMIGGLTPPVGVLVYVAAGTTGQAAGPVFRAVLPLMAALLAGLMILTLWPGLSLL